MKDKLTRERVLTLVGPRIKDRSRRYKWRDSVAGSDGYIYGIPFMARRVVRFNPVDKSLVEIGPDLGNGGWKYRFGVLANNGIIYCIPNRVGGRLLKIDTTSTCTTTMINTNHTNHGETSGQVTLVNLPLPESGHDSWISGALGLDGCIYYMPHSAQRILKFDPECEIFSLVGNINNLDNNDERDDDGSSGSGSGSGSKFHGTVIDNEGNVYGIPDESTRVVKYNPTTGHTTTVGAEFDEWPEFESGVLLPRGVVPGEDDANHDDHGAGADCIYANNRYGTILKIDIKENNHSIVYQPKIDHGGDDPSRLVLGSDGCLYLPPSGGLGTKTLQKFDAVTNVITKVGNEIKYEYGHEYGHDHPNPKDSSLWTSGALAFDGVIYCLPFDADQVLAINPCGNSSV